MQTLTASFHQITFTFKSRHAGVGCDIDTMDRIASGIAHGDYENYTIGAVYFCDPANGIMRDVTDVAMERAAEVVARMDDEDRPLAVLDLLDSYNVSLPEIGNDSEHRLGFNQMLGVGHAMRGGW